VALLHHNLVIVIVDHAENIDAIYLMMTGLKV
jgi:hypothetical protein